jgi:hypothetical protein
MPDVSNLSVRVADASAFRKFFSGLAGLFKDDPTAGDVHVDVPLGGDGKPKKPKKKPGYDTVKFEKAQVLKVSEELGLVFGFAIVCKRGGADYYDVQDDHIPEDAMLTAATDFMENSRLAKEMHAGDGAGTVVFAFPMTSEIASALNIQTQDTGLLIAMKPEADMLAKFKAGDLTGFSIGGSRGEDEEVAA